MTSTHAVVKWVKENNQFSIVKLTTISENKPVLDMIYKVYFDNEFHDGQVKFIGDQNTCKIKQNQILGLIASPKLGSKNKTSVSTQLASPQLTAKSNTPKSSQLASPKLNAKTKSKGATQLASPLSTTKNKPTVSTQQTSPKPKPTSSGSSKPFALSMTSIFNLKPKTNTKSSDRYKPIISFTKSKFKCDDDDENENEDDEEDENDAVVVAKPAMKAKAVANLLFEQSKEEVDYQVMKQKYEQMNLDREKKFELISQLKERNAHLEEQNLVAKTKITPEDIERQLLVSLCTIKAYGRPEHLVEISEFAKSSNSLKSQVALCSEYPAILISTLKRDYLLELFKKKEKGSYIFTQALSIYYPLDTDWSSRNAETFLKECPDTIDAILGFILQNNIDPISSFLKKEVRSVLTIRCSDKRKKVEKQKKADVEKEYLSGLNFNVDEDEIAKCHANQESQVVNENKTTKESIEFLQDSDENDFQNKVTSYQNDQVNNSGDYDDGDFIFSPHCSDVDDEEDDDDVVDDDEDDGNSISEIDDNQAQPRKRYTAPLNDAKVNASISLKHKLLSTGSLNALNKSKKNKQNKQ